MKDNLDASTRLRDKIKNFLKKILGTLAQILLILLPILLVALPPIKNPPLPPGITKPPFITIPLPPIIPPGAPTIGPIYRTEGPGAPEAAFPPDVGEEEPFETYGNLMFQLAEEPNETISFQIESLSDNLEFDENIITFPIESWDTPVYINFISTLETSSENIVGDLDDKLSALKQEKVIDKRPNIQKGSLDDYSVTPEELNAQRRRLEYLLKPAETIQEALAKINKRVRIRGEIVEPTYEGGFEEYRGIVEPTYYDYEKEEVVEPVYEESEYTPYEETVYPSEKIVFEPEEQKIKEEIVEPVYEESQYKPYEEEVVPMLEGGQENDYEVPDLDYEDVANEIDVTQLDDNYKAEIEFILLEDISSEVNIYINVLDSTWAIQPNMITFDYDIPSTNAFFFSQEIFDTLQDLHVEQYANKAEEEFGEYIDDTYESGMNRLDKEEEDLRKQEEEIYDDVYNKTYQQEMSKISDAQYVLNQLGGYTNPSISSLYNRTRKLSRVVK